MTINCELKTFTASDGYEFHFRHWRPRGTTPRGYVVALHGIQSHSGWYEYSSAKLAEAGYDVRFLDRRGSGLNEKNRGDAAGAMRLVNDVVQFLNAVRRERDECAPAAPLSLLAVSWGAKVAASLAGVRPNAIDALVLLYPGICTHVRVVWHQRLRLRLARSLGILDKRIQIPLDDPALFTPVPEWQKYIADDAMALHETTISFLNSSLDLDLRAAAAPDSIYVPVLVVLAGRDRIIDNAATRRYVGRIASSEKVIVEYPDAGHTLEFEPNRAQIFNMLEQWLSNLPLRVSPNPPPATISPINRPHFNVSHARSPSHQISD